MRNTEKLKYIEVNSHEDTAVNVIDFGEKINQLL